MLNIHKTDFNDKLFLSHTEYYDQFNEEISDL